MKLKAHNIALLIFLIAPLFSWAKKGEVTASKHYEESFSISEGGQLDLDASFSSFSLEVWDKNEVFISGDVNIEASNQKKADKLLENFEVKMSQSGNTVNCEVGMGGNNSWNTNGSTEMNVRFVIKAPSWILLDANLSFGELELNSLKNAKLNIEYSELNAGSLEGSNNEVDMSFSDASIGNFGGGKLENSYGELSIGKLSGNTDLENSYGEMKIQTLTNSVKSLDIENSFGETTVTVPSSMTYDINSESSFGEVKIKGDWNEKSSDSDFQEEEKRGTLGSGSSNGSIEVECSFGEVKIEQG